MKVGNETVNVSGKKLKSLAKDSLEDKADEEEQFQQEKEANKMSDLI